MLVIGSPIAQFFGNNGTFLSGGYVYSYVAEASSTLKATYPTVADALASTNANTNPHKLNSRGEMPLVLNGATKLIVTDSDLNVINTFDDLDSTTGNVTDANGNALLNFTTIPNSVNYFQITNAATGNNPRFAATGGDNNLDADIRGKGTGGVKINNAYKLPTTDGTSGQSIATDGAGTLSWSTAITAGRQLGAPQVFTATGTYTKTAGTNYIVITATGGGGGGGGGASGGGGGGGGGAGGTVAHRQSAPASTYTVTVGTGGAGGANTGAVGANGIDTTVGALLTASGGVGGTGGSITNCVSGGAGGAAASGSICNNPGGGGGAGIYIGGTTTASGAGGSSFWGGGANGVSTNVAGVNAAAYGAGGSGGAPTSGTGRAGGNGKDGYVVIYEYS